mmetsp:Transcript_9809/g.18402  ORF Transcript_9809/g.18402 Transcript_9809/m.18402 type:complete len:229 (-) Transcript_9809:2089-2775(-)
MGLSGFHLKQVELQYMFAFSWILRLVQLWRTTAASSSSPRCEIAPALVFFEEGTSFRVVLPFVALRDSLATITGEGKSFSSSFNRRFCFFGVATFVVAAFLAFWWSPFRIMGFLSVIFSSFSTWSSSFRGTGGGSNFSNSLSLRLYFFRGVVMCAAFPHLFFPSRSFFTINVLHVMGSFSSSSGLDFSKVTGGGKSFSSSFNRRRFTTARLTGTGNSFSSSFLLRPLR